MDTLTHVLARTLPLALFATLALVNPKSRAGGLAFDTAGNLYLSERESVLKFAPDGTRSTFTTGLKNASGLAFDHKGNLFVSDAGSLTVYRVAGDGTKTPFMTNASAFGLALDPADNLYLAQGGTVYKFAADGTRSKFASALGNARDMVIDAAGNVYVLDLTKDGSTTIHKYAADGKETVFLNLIYMDEPAGLAVDATGHIYLAAAVSGDSSAILKVNADQQKSTFAAATNTTVLGSIAADKAGNAFIYNAPSMPIHSRSFRKFNELGARTISASPDKQWEYRWGLDHFPEIAKAGEKAPVLDLDSEGGGAPHPDEDAIVWAPDSKSFAFNFSPPHASHTSYEVAVIYQLRGEEWVAAKPLTENSSNFSQLAQLGRGRLPKKFAHDPVGDRDVLHLDHWIDSETAVIHVYSSGTGKSHPPASYDFTVKFDAQGKWKIVATHPSKEE